MGLIDNLKIIYPYEVVISTLGKDKRTRRRAIMAWCYENGIWDYDISYGYNDESGTIISLRLAELDDYMIAYLNFT